jgi:phosphoserine phosphatase
MKNLNKSKVIASTAAAALAALTFAGCGSTGTVPETSSATTSAVQAAKNEETKPTETKSETTTAAETTAAPEEKPDESEKAADEPVLTLWTDDAPAKEKLTEYIASITVEGSEDYIPPEDRIAVFDFDGTLFCETDPNYFDYTLLKYRVLEDPGYKDKASDFEKETAEKIKKQNETGESFKGLETDHGKAVASAFAGMTIDEFNDYIQEFKKQDMPSYEGMKRGEGYYKPMLEVVDYLEDNDFTVYIVSGTDRFIVRGIVYDSELKLPNRQIIGSDESVVAPDQGDTDGLEYVYDDNDKLVLGGEFLIKNLKMNKVTVINQEIGQQPVLSFGNSSGDSSMAEYVTSGNKYKSLAFMLCCDDTERENGNEEKAQKMYDMCEEFDWVPVSMKNDWTTIYGDGVTYVKK